MRDRASIPAKRLVCLAVDAEDADAAGYEPVHLGDRLVGFVTSGGYGHCAKVSLAMAYIDSNVPAGQEGLNVSIVGEARRCEILRSAAIDAEGTRLRA
jgi:dimethylglycine dehydrogenase